MARTKSDPELVAAMRQACSVAWKHWRAASPEESFYAFALYTTPMGEYYHPVACGEVALGRIAAAHHAKHVGEPGGGSLEQAREGLRWVMAESPYFGEGQGFGDAIGEVLARRPSPYGPTERASEREIAIRHESAVDALKALDNEGLFGLKRDRPILLIEAGDREEHFVLGFAKRLNPKAVFQAFERPLLFQPKGRFTSITAKKVYDVSDLELVRSAGLAIAASGSEGIFCFDISLASGEGESALQGRLLWRGPRGDAPTLQRIAASADARMFAATYDEGQGDVGVVHWHSNDWKTLRRVALPQDVVPLDIVVARDATWFAVSSMDNRVRIMRTSDGAELACLDGPLAWPRRVELSPDGRVLATADARTGVRTWDVASFVRGTTLPRPADGVTFSPDGRYVYTTLEFGPELDSELPEMQSVLIWDIVSSAVVHDVRVPGWRIVRAAASTDQSLIACICNEIGGARHAAFAVEVITGRIVAELDLGVPLREVAFIGSRTLAVSPYAHDEFSALVVWDIRGGRHGC